MNADAQLTEKYRPRELAEVLAQPEIVRSLKAFVANPTPGAFLFSGDSGCGKTSAAYALARELGCDVDSAEMGGFYEIPSGEMSADQVRERLAAMRFRPFSGSGWRVLLCNEADRMSRPSETIWLDGLEKLGAFCVVIFTTNEPERLSQRFRDRCEHYDFKGGSERLKPYIAELARTIWAKEGCPGEVPNLETLGMPTLGAREDMAASFRLAVKQLQRLVRDAKANLPALPAAAAPADDEEPDNVIRPGRLDAAHFEAVLTARLPENAARLAAKTPGKPAAATSPAAPVSEPSAAMAALGVRWEAGEWITTLAVEAGTTWQRLLRELRKLGYEAHEGGKHKKAVS